MSDELSPPEQQPQQTFQPKKLGVKELESHDLGSAIDLLHPELENRRPGRKLDERNFEYKIVSRREIERMTQNRKTTFKLDVQAGLTETPAPVTISANANLELNFSSYSDYEADKELTRFYKFKHDYLLKNEKSEFATRLYDKLKVPESYDMTGKSKEEAIDDCLREGSIHRKPIMEAIDAFMKTSGRTHYIFGIYLGAKITRRGEGSAVSLETGAGTKVKGFGGEGGANFSVAREQRRIITFEKREGKRNGDNVTEEVVLRNTYLPLYTLLHTSYKNTRSAVRQAIDKHLEEERCGPFWIKCRLSSKDKKLYYVNFDEETGKLTKIEFSEKFDTPDPKNKYFWVKRKSPGVYMIEYCPPTLDAKKFVICKDDELRIANTSETPTTYKVIASGNEGEFSTQKWIDSLCFVEECETGRKVGYVKKKKSLTKNKLCCLVDERNSFMFQLIQDALSVEPKGIDLDATCDSITAKWNVISSNKRHGTITHYALKLEDEHGAIQHEEKEVTATVWTFNKLDPGSAYKVHVAGANKSDCGPFGTETIITEHTAPSVMPQNVRLDATCDSITAKWDSIPSAKHHGTINDYVLRIEDEHGTIREEKIRATEWTFKQLDPVSTYKIHVAGANRSGHGPFATETVTTKQTAPSVVPQNIHLDATSGSITAKWDSIPTAKQYGTIMDYVLRLEDGHGTILEEKKIATNFYKRMWTFKQLDPGATYKIHVAGANKSGHGPVGTETITTKQAAPSVKPQNVHLDATCDSITAKWDSIPTTKEHGTITEYVLRLEDERGAIQEEKVTATEWTFKQLDPGSTYKIHIAGANKSSRGPFVIATITTVLPDVATADFSSLDTAKHLHQAKVPLTITSIAKIDLQYSLRLSRNNSSVGKVSMDTEASYFVVTPQERGRHLLEIKASGQHIKGSPYHFEVGTPLNTFDFKNDNSYGLTASEDKVFLSVSNGIKVFKDQRPFDFFPLKDREELAGITAHQKTGDVFVATGRTGEVLKLSSDGVLIGSVKLGCQPPLIPFSNGLNVNSKDELYVSDNLTHTIQVFDLDLKHKRTLTGHEKNCKHFQSPRAVVVGKDGKVYIAEQTRIQVLSPDEEFIQMIGEEKICDARGLKVLHDHIYVAHRGCASLYSTDGTHIRDFYKYDPSVAWVDITVDCDGYVYISDTNKLYIM